MDSEFSGFLITFSLSFVLLVISVFSIAFFARSIITKFRKRESGKMRSWVKLAKSHRWKLVFDKSSRDGAYVKGNYRGHHLRLETFQRDTVSEVSKIYTRLTLSIKNELHTKEEKRSASETTSQGFISTISSSELNAKLKERIDVDKDVQVIKYEQAGVEEDVGYLRFLFGLMSDVAEAYLEVIELGGEAVSLLQPIAVEKSNKFQGLVRHLLQEISRDTTDRLAHQANRLLCTTCLTKCSAHQFKPSRLETITYYGCRTCQQSRDFITWEGVIVARLDKNMVSEQVQEIDELQINWLMRDEMFDFDKVKIEDVTDEDVERFVVKVGNDTDPVRKLRYKKTLCEITALSILSENSLKILRHTFDEVEIK